MVVSTAYAGRIEGIAAGRASRRAAAQAPTIVVSGAHGKTTTAAMIAFVLDRLGLDPSFAIGGEVPQLGANARAGTAGSCSRATSPIARSRRFPPASP